MYDFAPMLGQLPDTIDAMRHASQGTRLQGSVALRRCERLRPALLNDEGAVQVDLSFGQDAEHRPVVIGTIRGTLPMLCQRCEQPLMLAVDAQIQVGLVRNDEDAQRLPEHLEPCLLMADRMVSLTTLVEDELILALPIVPRHEQECGMRVASIMEPIASTQTERKNPFAILEQLRSGKDGDQQH